MFEKNVIIVKEAGNCHLKESGLRSLRSVWPDDELKSSQFFSKILPTQFLPETWGFQNSPKVIIRWATFVS